MHEGITDPGGTWNTPDHITPALAGTVAAALPGGFRTNRGPVGNRGGYYDQGRAAEPLRTGAASLVVAAGGTVSIGQWGRDVSMNPSVRSVRQNLDLLVDGGTVNPACSSGSTPVWGYGVGNSSYVPRTGIGQRADGALEFVNRPVTSVCSLGRLLVQAGAVRGMQLGHQLRLEHRLLLHPRSRHRAPPRRPQRPKQRPRALLYLPKPRLHRLLPALTQPPGRSRSAAAERDSETQGRPSLGFQTGPRARDPRRGGLATCTGPGQDGG